MSQTRTTIRPGVAATTIDTGPAAAPVLALALMLAFAAAAGAAAPGATVATGATSERLAAPPDATPRYVRVLAGVWQAGGVEEVSASDDEFYVLEPELFAGGGEEGGGDLLVAEVAVGFQLAAGVRPRKIRFELETVGCFTVDIGLRRWNSSVIGDDAVDVLSSTSHCLEEGDAVSIAANVPRQTNAEGSWLGPHGTIEVDVLVVTEVGATAGDEGSDRNVDEVTVETDY